MYLWKCKRWTDNFEEMNPLASETKYVSNY